jgi:hypothetical protein
MSLPVRLAALLCVLPLVLAACSSEPDESASPDDDPSETQEGSLPEGWTEVEQEGITFGVPAEFEQVDGPGATVSYGIPYTDQTFPPPKVDLFVENEEVGPLDVRIPLVVGNIENELGVSVGEPEEVEVAGASAAAQFSYEYTTQGGTSVSGVELEPTQMRQTDVLIDAPGLPKYGLRYAAPADQYDDGLWEALVASITVAPRGSDQG